ncbi:GNAT family N-acetyltransferase [Salinarimonas ramus]|uniref:Acetyltransferase n=1 Tax=Salinarimonas ramus TaxID=690164 RepID=A0A917QF86_9HYPH|nr:GNAT family N-acetyltransferase [Salinarimonas ramus]GGK46063.1 acetyltransferase [Salinarimonas ramus]
MNIRPYDAARDLERCLAIWRAASEVGHPFLGREALDADADLVRDVYMPRAETYVAEEDGRVVGFVALLDAFVGGLFVDPAAHGRGVGAALVAHAARKQGLLEVEVYAQNAGARAFYTRVGFVETQRRDEDDQGRPHALVRMTRPAPG